MVKETLHTHETKTVDLLLGFHDRPRPDAFADTLRARLEETSGQVVVIVESILFPQKYADIIAHKTSEETFSENYYKMYAAFEHENPDIAACVNKESGPWQYRADQLATLDALSKDFPDRIKFVVETVPDENILFPLSIQATNLETKAAAIVRGENVTMEHVLKAAKCVKQAIALEVQISSLREQHIRNMIEANLKNPKTSAVIVSYGAAHEHIAALTDLTNVTINVTEENAETNDEYLYTGVRSELMNQQLEYPEEELNPLQILQAVVAEGLGDIVAEIPASSHIHAKFRSLTLIENYLPTFAEVVQFFQLVEQYGFDTAAGTVFDEAFVEEFDSNPVHDQKHY